MTSVSRLGRSGPPQRSTPNAFPLSTVLPPVKSPFLCRKNLTRPLSHTTCTVLRSRTSPQILPKTEKLLWICMSAFPNIDSCAARCLLTLLRPPGPMNISRPPSDLIEPPRAFLEEADRTVAHPPRRSCLILPSHFGGTPMLDFPGHLPAKRFQPCFPPRMFLAGSSPQGANPLRIWPFLEYG